MDDRKAYGVISALGKAIGERARAGDVAALEALRATWDRESFGLFLEALQTSLPPALVADFVATVTDETWSKTKAKIVLQAKMVAEGGAPAPGHEAKGGGVKGR